MISSEINENINKPKVLSRFAGSRVAESNDFLTHNDLSKKSLPSPDSLKTKRQESLRLSPLQPKSTSRITILNRSLSRGGLQLSPTNRYHESKELSLEELNSPSKFATGEIRNKVRKGLTKDSETSRWQRL
jgi:hypothetical protein